MCRLTRERNVTFPFFAFLGDFSPNPDQAVYSKVMVSFCGERFPSLLGGESDSFSYVERRVRLKLVEHEGFEERKEGRKE